MSERYLIPEKAMETEIRRENSRFISNVSPAFSAEEAYSYIQSIKNKYPDATHHVPAFIIGHGMSTSAYCSDNGEPSGTAGRPILSVLQGSGLGDIVIVVTRYFGGTKMGIGGLVHAYSDAAKSVLEVLPHAEKVPIYVVMLVIDYSLYDRVKLLIKKYNAITVDSEFTSDVTITVKLLQKELYSFNHDLSELSRGKSQAEIIEEIPDAIMPVGAFQ